MRKLLTLLVILLVGCSGSPGSTSTVGQPATSNAPSAAGGSAASGAPGGPSAPSTQASAATSGAPPASTTTALPADCATGLAAYLVAIEPIVSGFDPAKAKLGDLFTADDKVHEKSMELLDANDSRAPYSCSEVGLEWAYFNSRTPWDAVMAVAGESAPGTVAFLTAVQAISAHDVNTVSVYGIEGCDAVGREPQEARGRPNEEGRGGGRGHALRRRLGAARPVQGVHAGRPERGVPTRRAGQRRVRVHGRRGLRRCAAALDESRRPRPLWTSGRPAARRGRTAGAQGRTRSSSGFAPRRSTGRTRGFAALDCSSPASSPASVARSGGSQATSWRERSKSSARTFASSRSVTASSVRMSTDTAPMPSSSVFGRQPRWRRCRAGSRSRRRPPYPMA